MHDAARCPSIWTARLSTVLQWIEDDSAAPVLAYDTCRGVDGVSSGVAGVNSACLVSFQLEGGT